MEKNKTSEKIIKNIKESYKPKKKLKEEAGAPDIVFTACYNTLDVWLSRKDAMDFFEECMYGSEGSERERYVNIYFDLKAGYDLATDGDSDEVWEIAWMGNKVSTVLNKQKIERTPTKQVVAKIKGGKIMPPKEFLDVLGGLKESFDEPLVLDTELADKTFYDMVQVHTQYNGKPVRNDRERYYVEVKGYAGRTYTWEVGIHREGSYKGKSGEPYLFMDYMPSRGELSILDNLFHDYGFRWDDKEAILAEYIYKNKEKFMKQDKTKEKPKNIKEVKTKEKPKNIKEAKETKRQFEVFIEEVVSEEITVEAVDMDEAAEIIMNKYNKGEIVLEPGNLVTKSIMVRDPETEEETGWNEF